MKEYHVIEIVDEYEVIIDYGVVHGAKIDQRIKILEKGVPVINLSGESLGTREVVKEILTIFKVYEKFSICRNKKIAYNNLLNPTYQLFKPAIEYKEILIDKDDASYQKFISESPVKVGDLVTIVEEE